MDCCNIVEPNLNLQDDNDFIFLHLVKRLEKLLSFPDQLSDVIDLDLQGKEYPTEFIASVIDFFAGDLKKAKKALLELPPYEQKPYNSGSLIACMRQALPDVSDDDLDLAFFLAHFNFIEGIKLLKIPKNDRIPCENPPLVLPKTNDDEEEQYLSSILPEELRCPECCRMMCPSREPRILFPCGHTVCSCCSRYKCPICKRGVQMEKKNFIMISLIENILNHELIDECINCPICMAKFTYFKTPVALLPCGHTLCKSCLKSWRNMNSLCRCPFCRRIINDQVDNRLCLDLAYHS